MSVNEKLTAIADAIRAATGKADKLSLDKMAAAIPKIAEKCTSRHYTEIRRGDGTNIFAVNCGFKPDYFFVFSTSGYPSSMPNTILCAEQDLRCTGIYSAYRIQNKSNGERGNALINTAAAERFFIYENGIMRYDGSVASSETSRAYIFDACTDYIAVCFKYTDESDAEIITREVNALPAGGGTVTFSELKVNGAFTDSEWQTLIDAKPNWTFNLA